MKATLRAWRIARVALRYRLYDLFDAGHVPGWVRSVRAFVPAAAADLGRLARGARLRLALQELGPIFVKFGQVLSTRRDLIPPDVADELALLQDQVKPFDGARAARIVEQALGRSLASAYAVFDAQPLASASIAQVHAAVLPDGRDVVVKVLRPDIEQQIDADIALLDAAAGMVARLHPRAEKIRPREVVAEIAATLAGELDLQREAANASVLRRFWDNSPDLYVPEVVWSHTAQRALTLERVHGIPSDDLAALDAAGIDRKALAAKTVRVFYIQMFRDNFFHADAHAGNLWVDDDPARAADPRIVLLDFGIVGQLSDRDQYFLAENFMAIFRRDYRRVAELHVQAGWMPATVRIDELEAAARAVCEPYFTRPLSEIPLAEVLVKLFRTAQRYQLTLQPQLILLQKTLFNVEGLGRLLDPQLDIWAVAQPVLERILRQRYGPRRLLREFRRRLPAIVTQAPAMPQLVHDWLQQQVDAGPQPPLRATELARLQRVLAGAQQRMIAAITGVGLLGVAVLLRWLDLAAPHWGPLPVSTWVAGGLGVLALLLAWRR